MAALVARAIALASARPIVLVTADIDSARRLVDDLAFVWGTEPGDVLLFTPPEASPYADVNPDRRGAMARLVTLFHLAQRPVALPGGARVRPRAQGRPARRVDRHSERIVAEQEIDRDALIARLAAAGYLRVPLVEDPGTFAVRGALLDLWPPRASFRCASSSTATSCCRFARSIPRAATARDPNPRCKELWLPPAREAILTPGAVDRARELVRSLCDAVNISLEPSARAGRRRGERARVLRRRGLPARVLRARDALRLPAGRRASAARRPAGDHARAPRRARARARPTRPRRAARRTSPSQSSTKTRPKSPQRSRRARVLALHRTAVAGGARARDLTRFEVAPEETPSLAAHDQSDLERAIDAARASRGKHGALDPLIDACVAWHEAGSRCFSPRAPRRRPSGSPRSFATAIFPARCAPDPSTRPARRAEARRRDHGRGGLARARRGRAGRRPGARHRGGDLRRRAHRARARATREEQEAVPRGPARARGRRLRRPRRARHRPVPRPRPQGRRRPHRRPPRRRVRRRRQALPAGLPPEPDPEVLGRRGRAQARPARRADVREDQAARREAVRQMADELLRLYAERQAAAGRRAAPGRRRLPRLRGDLPVRRDARSGARHRRRAQAISRRRGRWTAWSAATSASARPRSRSAPRSAWRWRASRSRCSARPRCSRSSTSAIVRGAHARLPDHGRERCRASRPRRSRTRSLARLKDGKVDIVIGTHRLLSKDVHFKNLGLLVVDEEQRFGVTHKERIKQLSATSTCSRSPRRPSRARCRWR